MFHSCVQVGPLVRLEDVQLSDLLAALCGLLVPHRPLPQRVSAATALASLAAPPPNAACLAQWVTGGAAAIPASDATKTAATKGSASGGKAQPAASGSALPADHRSGPSKASDAGQPTANGVLAADHSDDQRHDPKSRPTAANGTETPDAQHSPATSRMATQGGALAQLRAAELVGQLTALLSCSAAEARCRLLPMQTACRRRPRPDHGYQRFFLFSCNCLQLHCVL